MYIAVYTHINLIYSTNERLVVILIKWLIYRCCSDTESRTPAVTREEFSHFRPRALGCSAHNSCRPELVYILCAPSHSPNEYLLWSIHSSEQQTNDDTTAMNPKGITFPKKAHSLPHYYSPSRMLSANLICSSTHIYAKRRCLAALI